MKILDVDIQNIRSYKELSLSLSPHLNVFRGKSDSGKSGFVKSLLFVIKNLVTKNTITKKSTGESFVKISDGKITIKRAKEGKSNTYSILTKSSSDPLKEYDAVAKQIPFKVQEALNLSDANVQEQKESYFLIDKSNGIISKKLNEVSGLSEIDRTLKAITTEINSLSSNTKAIENRIKEDKAKIEETKWTIQADIDLKIIESLDKEICNLEVKTAYLSTSIEEYTQIKNKMDSLLPESILSDYKELEDLEEEEDKQKSDIAGLNYHINKYERIKKEYDECEIIDLSEIDGISSEIDALTTDIKYLRALLGTYNTTKIKLSIAIDSLTETEKSIEEVEICPTCKRPL